MHAYTGNVTVLEHNILQTANGKHPLMDTLFSGFFSCSSLNEYFCPENFSNGNFSFYESYKCLFGSRSVMTSKQELRKSWRYIRDKHILEMIKTNVAHIHIRVKGWRKSSNLKMECIYSMYFLTVAQQVFFTDIQMPLNLLLQMMQNIYGQRKKNADL